MKPQELLATAKIPGQDGELKLYRHDGAFAFRAHGTELMTSRVHGSEEMLAELALEQLGVRPAPRVLVGGLGMGFTLAKVLELVPADARVDVVELVPEVIAWNREWLGGVNGQALQDPRVTVHEGDVVPHVRGPKAIWDAILLDVDNGPEGLTRDANDRLYSRNGLEAASAALRPGGVLAIWSAAYHSWFPDRMRRAGLEVAEHRVRARRTKGPRRMIWVATRAAG